MGNQNSADSTEPQYVVDYNAPKKKPPPSKTEEKVPIQRKTEQHDGGNNKVLKDDDIFTEYIQRAKYKIKRLSTVGRHHEEQHKPAAPDHQHHVPAANNVVVETDSNMDKNEVDQFSHFIQNARKRLTTRVSTLGKKNNSFKKGNTN